MSKPVLSLIALQICFSLPAAVSAAEPLQQKPLWELGFGAGSLYAPDYPAASERRLRSLALPYIVYRGEVFRMGDGQSARAVAFANNRVELDLSIDAAFDADSEENALRSGMPDLDYMVQVGPQLTVKLKDFQFAQNGTGALVLALQARAVLSSDLRSIDQQGYVFEPMLRYRQYGLLSPDFDLTVSVKPLWASADLHAYFYDVAPRYVRTDRPAFRSDKGYFGTDVNFYGSYRLNAKASLFLGLQTTFQQGAVNADSPLFKKRFTAGMGAGFIYKPWISERLVASP